MIPVAELLYSATYALARLLGRTKLHSIRVETDMFRKRRTPVATCLLPLINLGLRIFSSRTRALPAAEWLERECRIARCFGNEASVERGTLILPYCDAPDVPSYLQQGRTDLSTQRSLVQGSAKMLRELHARLDEGHGDARLENALRLGDGTVRWIDFDVGLLSTLSLHERNAEDFRALMFSAARWMSELTAREIVTLVSAEMDGDSRNELRKRLAPEWQRSLLFFLAQAALPRARYRELRKEILDIPVDTPDLDRA